jgi:hypothetical protein
MAMASSAAATGSASPMAPYVPTTPLPTPADTAPRAARVLASPPENDAAWRPQVEHVTAQRSAAWRPSPRPSGTSLGRTGNSQDRISTASCSIKKNDGLPQKGRFHTKSHVGVFWGDDSACACALSLAAVGWARLVSAVRAVDAGA